MTDQLEPRLRESLQSRLDGIPVNQGDLEAVRRRGGRRRRVQLGAAAVTALVVLGGLVTTAVLSQQRSEPPALTGRGEWVEVAPSPLSPRWSSVAVWTGKEVLFLGGGEEPPCPPNTDCAHSEQMTRDGAAYDPATDQWRDIADAPVEVGYWFRPVLVDGAVVVRGSSATADEEIWLRYDVDRDTWTELPDAPGGAVDQGGISALDGEVYVLDEKGVVLALDPGTATWRRLPASDLAPRIEAQHVVATPAGVFVTGPSTAVPEDGDTARYVMVDRWDGGRWERLGTTGQIGSAWHWTGERLVNADPQVAPGLDGRPPHGGVFDPGTRQWSPLPNAPDVEREGFDGWGVVAAEGPLMAGWGAVYDDRDGSWTPLGRPRGTPVERPAGAVWADGRIVAFGGLDPESGYVDVGGLSNEAWVWRP